MDITKVKYEPEAGRVQIKWTEDSDTSNRDTTFTCYDRPLQEFLDAFNSLVPAALNLIGAPEVWAERGTVSGVSITHEEERIGAVVTVLIDLGEKTKGPLVINTPYLVDDDENGPCMEPDMLTAVDAIQREAKRYVRGERAQADFFAGQGEAA
mgnify:CR=1 FL=1